MKTIIINIIILLLFNGCNSDSSKSPNINNEVSNAQKIQDIRNFLKGYDSTFLRSHLKEIDIYGLFGKFGYPIEWDKIEDYMVKADESVTEKEEGFVYFYKSDFDDIFKHLNCDDNAGIRVYIYKYKKELKNSGGFEHPYKNHYTVVLRGTCKNTPSSDPFTVYDYGDLCPPNCKELSSESNWIPKLKRNKRAAMDGVYSR